MAHLRHSLAGLITFICLLSCNLSSAQPQLIWSDAEIGQILRTGISGGIPEVIVAKNFPAYHTVDFVHGKIYWTDTGTRSVHAVNLDGSDREVVISGLTEPQGIDLEGEHLILVDHTRIARYDLEGNLVSNIIENLDNPTDLIVHEGFIYWGDRGTSSIFRTPVNGMNRQEIIDEVYVLVDIEINPLTDELYWTQAPGIPDQSGIFKASTNGSGRQTVLQEFISGIAIDAQNDLIYYSEAVDHTIHRAPLNDPANDVALIDEFLRDPVTLTIDNAGGRMFFLNEQYRDFLYTAGLNGDGLEVLVSSDVNRPTRFALDTANRHIYWVNARTDANDDESAAIMRADMDGTNVTELIDHPDVIRPFGLALDLSDGRLYWSDLAKRGIYSASLSGANIETVVEGGLLAPRGIALDNTNARIFWCDSNAGKIQSAGKDGSDPIDVISSGLEAPYGVWVSAEGSSIYFTDHLAGRIGRFDLGGETFETLINTQNPATNRPNSVFADMVDEKIYYTIDFDDPKLMRANLDGSGQESIDVPDIASPHDIYVVQDIMSSSIKPNQPDSDNEATAYPNPFHRYCTVESKIPMRAFHLTDITGRIILAGKPSEDRLINLNTTGLPAGMFQMHLTYADNSAEVIRLVKSGN